MHACYSLGSHRAAAIRAGTSAHPRSRARALRAGVPRNRPLHVGVSASQIDTRYFAAPLEWFATPRSFKQCNDLFILAATELGAAAAGACLSAAGYTADAIDHLIWVSTTGMAAPSPDAMLINRLGMGRHAHPIWGLGCAGGGWPELARAYEYTRAFPDQRVLLLSVDCAASHFSGATARSAT
ncbi:MAG: hypothetical protein U0Z44_08965 [Kouleothrix sp.]